MLSLHHILRVAALVIAICVAGFAAADQREKKTSPRSTRLEGRFVFDGDPPKRKKITELVVGVRQRLPSVPKDALDASLVIGKDRGIANIFVYVRSTDIPFDKTKVPRESVHVTADSGQFFPHAMAFQSRSSLQVDNTMKQPINFRTQFARHHNFNFLIPINGSQRIKLKSQPLPTRYQCDIYPWMKGVLLVMKHPYMAVSDEKGRFRIDNLPAGEWEFEAWHESVGVLKTAAWPKGRRKLKISAGINRLGTIQVKPRQLKKRPAP